MSCFFRDFVFWGCSFDVLGGVWFVFCEEVSWVGLEDVWVFGVFGLVVMLDEGF